MRSKQTPNWLKFNIINLISMWNNSKKQTWNSFTKIICNSLWFKVNIEEPLILTKKTQRTRSKSKYKDSRPFSKFFKVGLVSVRVITREEAKIHLHLDVSKSKPIVSVTVLIEAKEDTKSKKEPLMLSQLIHLTRVKDNTNHSMMNIE